MAKGPKLLKDAVMQRIRNKTKDIAPHLSMDPGPLSTDGQKQKKCVQESDIGVNKQRERDEEERLGGKSKTGGCNSDRSSNRSRSRESKSRNSRSRRSGSKIKTRSSR